MGLTGPKYRDFINTCGDIMIVMGIYKQLNVTLKGLSEKEGVYPIYIRQRARKIDKALDLGVPNFQTKSVARQLL